MSSLTRNVAAGVFAWMGLVGFTAAAVAARPVEPAVDRDRWIALFPGDAEPILHESSVPVWDREEGVVIAGPSESQLDSLRTQGIEPVFSAPDHGEGIHVLSHDRYFTRKTATAYELYIFGGATAEFAPVLLNDMWRLTIPLAGGE